MAAIALALTIASPAAAADQSVVETRSGAVEGVAEGESTAYRGIPYARPPVGDLRWRAPQPAEPWQKLRVADSFGPDCMQIPYKADAAPLGVKPSEDCLYLNVWTPAARPRAKLPVMVWIYGGGFVNGGSSPPTFHWPPVRVTCVAGQAGMFAALGEPAGGPLGRLLAGPAESTTRAGAASTALATRAARVDIGPP